MYIRTYAPACLLSLLFRDILCNTLLKHHDHHQTHKHGHPPRARSVDTHLMFTQSKADPCNIKDGIGRGEDAYTAYTGDGSAAAGWPTITQWVSFDDMFNANKDVMRQACANIDPGVPDTTDSEIGQIWTGIQIFATQTQVDHRFILAILLQESEGCVRVHTTNNHVDNPGLMQSHAGKYSCNRAGNIMVPCPDEQIHGMIQDGVVGTDSGDGMVALLNQEGDDGEEAQTHYRAARLYNSGSINRTALEYAFASTRCYASDIANRLTGWVYAESECHEIV